MRKPAYFKDGKVIIHPHIKKYSKTPVKMAGSACTLTTNTVAYRPLIFGQCHQPYFESANNHVTGYMGLTAGQPI